jgi:hypothetical protein
MIKHIPHKNLHLASVCSNKKYTTVVKNVKFRNIIHQIFIVSLCTLRRTNMGTQRTFEIVFARLSKLYWWKVPVFSGLMTYNVTDSQQNFEGTCYVHFQNQFRLLFDTEFIYIAQYT